MNTWKVILATLVIFGCGVLTGTFVVGGRPTRSAQVKERLGKPSLPPPGVQRFEFMRKATKRLELTPQQQARVDKILLDSQERTKQFFDRIAPQMRDEMRRVSDEIRAELTPEQQKTFETQLKARPARRGETPNGDEKHHWPPGLPKTFPGMTNGPSLHPSASGGTNGNPSH